MKSIRTKVVLTLLSGTILLASAPIAFAASQTVVRGNVYDESNGGKGIGGLTVSVTCQEKKKSVTKTDITDGSGLYTVNFKSKQCDKFDPVTASVTFNGQTQTETVLVSSQNTATLDFYFGSANVPEFSLLTGSLAVLGSLGAFFAIKTRLIS